VPLLPVPLRRIANAQLPGGPPGFTEQPSRVYSSFLCNRYRTTTTMDDLEAFRAF
jgi:hypothetical protein